MGHTDGDPAAGAVGGHSTPASMAGVQPCLLPRQRAALGMRPHPVWSSKPTKAVAPGPQWDVGLP